MGNLTRLETSEGAVSGRSITCLSLVDAPTRSGLVDGLGRLVVTRATAKETAPLVGRCSGVMADKNIIVFCLHPMVFLPA
jgi:hypothetical protein